MKAWSAFSGVGGLDLGFERAGIQTVLQIEIDPWCNAVLERHWPEVKRVRDIRDVGADRAGRTGGAVGAGNAAAADAAGVGRPDAIFGGFPCQDVSVAGRRSGLSGERSGLWFEFERLLRELRPRWCVLENVPGLLSSGPEPGADFGVILRGLVELGYGVAWRILDARWFGVPQRRRRVFVVACAGDARRAAQVLAVCESCGGHPQTGGAARQDVAFTLADGAPETSRRIGYLPEVTAAESSMDEQQPTDESSLIAGSQLDEGMARPLVARGTGYRMDLESETFVVADTVRVEYGEQSFRGDGADNLVLADPISTREGKTYTHEGANNFRTHNLVDGVRRLTPLECERLMGFPDDHTRWTADGKEIPDSHRYRMCGNGVVATVAEWLGHRLVEVDRW